MAAIALICITTAPIAVARGASPLLHVAFHSSFLQCRQYLVHSAFLLSIPGRNGGMVNP